MYRLCGKDLFSARDCSSLGFHGADMHLRIQGLRGGPTRSCLNPDLVKQGRAGKLMPPSNLALLLVVLLSASNLLAFWIFAIGFVSTRLELPHRSAPEDADLAQCTHNSSSSPGCGHLPGHAHFDRVVVLLVDALRVDFVFPTALRRMHEGQMPRLAAMLQEAGGMPTFLDIGNSFSASAVAEDSLLLQMFGLGKRMVVMGDDTWMQMAPWAFEAGAHPFPSFNVLDLHTVDNGVMQHLEPYLRQPASSWDLLIAHFLGVDHAGHSHGAVSQEMVDKLQQVDGWVEHATRLMMEGAGPGGPYERSLLLVFGDHAQTLSGDHGGGSHDETDSLLMAFNLGKWHAAAALPQRQTRGVGAAEEGDAGDGDGEPPVGTGAGGWHSDNCPAGNNRGQQQGCREAEAAERLQQLLTNGAWGVGLTGDKQARHSGEGGGQPHRGSCYNDAPPAAGASLPPSSLFGCYQGVMSQVDFAASLSLSLGVPIPFGNVGRVDPSWWAMATAPASAPATAPALATASLDPVVDVGEPTSRAKADANGAGLAAGGGACDGDDRVGGGSEDGGDAAPHTAHQHVVSLHDVVPQAFGEYLAALRYNAWQVHRYLSTYASHASLPASDMRASNELYDEAVQQYEQYNSLVQQYTSRPPSQPCPPACAAASAAGADDALGLAGRNAADQSQSGGPGTDPDSRLYAVAAAREAALQAGLRLLEYLERAADVARDKFSRTHLPTMVAGCALMVGSLALHLWVAARLYRGPWRALLAPECAVAVSLAAFHALSLFGVTWIMGEGRVQCACVALLTAAMWASTLKSLHTTRSVAAPLSPSLATPTASNGACTGPAVRLDAGGTDAALTVSLAGCWSSWAAPLLAGCAALVSCFALQCLGLFDRSGQDPHDKSQPQALTDLMGRMAGRGGVAGPGAGLQSLLLQALLDHGSVLLPLLAMPLLLATCHRALRGPERNRASSAPRGRALRSGKPCRPGRQAVAALRLPWGVLMAVCIAQHACIAAWWLAEFLGLGKQTLGPLLLPRLHAWACGGNGAVGATEPCSGFLMQQAQQVLLLLHGTAAGGALWRAAADAAAALVALPLSMLLPRIVYVAALAALAAELVAGAARLLASSRSAFGSGGGSHAGHGQGRPSAGHHVWLLGCLIAPTTLLLGRRGPLTMLLGVLLLASLATLCATNRAALTASHALRRRRRPQRGSRRDDAAAATGKAPAAVEEALQQQEPAVASSDGDGSEVLWGVTCPTAWSMSGLMLFFCSGHFCEFSGLQYTSPFIGFDDMEWYTSGAMLTANTFGAMALPALALPLLSGLQAAAGAAAEADEEGEQGSDGGDECWEQAEAVTLCGGDAEGSLPGEGGEGEGRLQQTAVAAVAGASEEEFAARGGGGGGHGRQGDTAEPRAPSLPPAVASPNGAHNKVAAEDGDVAGACALPSRQTGSGSVTSVLPLSVVVYSTVCTLNACVSVLCATVLHKNVVVWAILAPKVVFELFFIAVTALALALGLIMSTP